MKTLKVICLTLLCCMLYQVSCAASINLLDAIKRKMVKIEMAGAGGHNGKCISMKLQNLSNRSLDLKLDAGHILKASDTSTQDMLLTQDIFVKVEAGKTRKFTLYAMCSEKNNRSPSASIIFKVGEMGKGHLREMAQLIYKRKIQNSTGQAAVWCLTDNDHLSNITGDSADVRVLREFVSKVTGQKMEMPARKVIRRPAPQSIYKVSGMFDFSIHEARSQVTIRLKDSQGNIIKTWVDNETYYRGHHVQNFELSSEDLTAGEYTIELIIDNVTTMTRKVKIRG